VERSMEELLPDNLKAQLMKQSSGQAMDGINVSSMGLQEVAVDKAEFQSFVETMKVKDNVKKIMSALKSTAPEIYEAMVAERDVYMAKGLDELGVNLNGSVENTVAVMGMAHVDGVEKYLASQGWNQMTYPCAVIR
jgi:pheromone shutdown protein TraB